MTDSLSQQIIASLTFILFIYLSFLLSLFFYFTVNVHQPVNVFTKVITNSIDAISLLVSKSVRRLPAPWINEDIKRDIKDRNNTHKVLKSNKSDMALQAIYILLSEGIKTDYFRNL